MTARCPCCHQPLRKTVEVPKTVEDACREALDKGKPLPSLSDLRRATLLSRPTVIRHRDAFCDANRIPRPRDLRRPRAKK